MFKRIIIVSLIAVVAYYAGAQGLTSGKVVDWTHILDYKSWNDKYIVEQLAKETGTTTKTINVHHSHPVKNKAGNYVEPSYVVRHYKSKNPIKYFDSKQDAEKWVENNYGFLKGKRMGERTGEPDELVNYATDIVEISSDIKKGKNDMFAIEIKGDKLKEPISAYKEGGLVLLDEAREYYK